jgi:hypothetical protein
MESKIPLKPRCKLIGVNAEDPAITSFFCETLGIPNVTWQDLVDELEHIQELESKDVSFSNVYDIYRLLYTFRGTDDWSSDELR